MAVPAFGIQGLMDASSDRERRRATMLAFRREKCPPGLKSTKSPERAPRKLNPARASYLPLSSRSHTAP